MILKAIAASGSLSAGLRSTSLPLRSMPLMAPRSSGLGRKSTTASSSGCTPLFLKAEPHRTGTNLRPTTALRISALSVASSGSLPSRYCSHRLVVELDRRLDQLGAILERPAPCRSAGISSSWYFAPSPSSSHTTAFMRTRSMTPLNALSDADRKLDAHRVGRHPRDQIVDALVEVGADLIHLVDEDDARHVVLVGLAPHRLGLRLDALVAVEHAHGAVEHAQRALDLDREVDVPGRVDDVEPLVLPEAGGRRGRDGDAALLLLLHPVHGRGAFVHLAHLVALAGVIEDPLRGRGLAGIDVGHDAEIAVVLDRMAAGHGEGPVVLSFAVTSDNARRRGWLPPSGACPRAS